MYVKAVSAQFRSVCLDEKWYDVDAALDFVGIKKGMDITILEQQQNIPGKRNPLIKKWEIKIPDDLDPLKPVGNLYSMIEEKLNQIIDQNTNILNQNTNIIDLLMRIARKNKIDLDSYTTAGKKENDAKSS